MQSIAWALIIVYIHLIYTPDDYVKVLVYNGQYIFPQNFYMFSYNMDDQTSCNESVSTDKTFDNYNIG